MSASNESYHDLHLECACVQNCTALMFRDWDDDYPIYLEFWSRVGSRTPLRHRLKTAWKIILRRDHYCDDLILGEEDIIRINDFITAAIQRRAKVNQS